MIPNRITNLPGQPEAVFSDIERTPTGWRVKFYCPNCSAKKPHGLIGHHVNGVLQSFARYLRRLDENANLYHP